MFKARLMAMALVFGYVGLSAVFSQVVGLNWGLLLGGVAMTAILAGIAAAQGPPPGVVFAGAITAGLGTVAGAVTWTVRTAHDTHPAWWPVAVAEIAVAIAVLVQGARRLRATPTAPRAARSHA